MIYLFWKERREFIAFRIPSIVGPDFGESAHVDFDEKDKFEWASLGEVVKRFILDIVHESTAHNVVNTNEC